MKRILILNKLSGRRMAVPTVLGGPRDLLLRNKRKLRCASYSIFVEEIKFYLVRIVASNERFSG